MGKGIITVASFVISSSFAPNEASPISWENWANRGSANIGTWPSNSWMQSLKWKTCKTAPVQRLFKDECSYGSGEWCGMEECLTYCVHWKTLNAKLAKKSRAVMSPAAGRSVKPDVSKIVSRQIDRSSSQFRFCTFGEKMVLLFKKFDKSSSCGMLSGEKLHSFFIKSKYFLWVRHALPGNRSSTLSKTAFHVESSASLYSIRGIGSPLRNAKSRLISVWF